MSLIGLVRVATLTWRNPQPTAPGSGLELCCLQVEMLAKQVLHDPVEVQVGGRNVVNKDIRQSVELRPEGERFLRLLEILGQWCELGKVLIFVQTQEQCDNLLRHLLQA